MFHDGRFEGLWVDGKSAHIFLATETRERHVLVALGVVVLKLDGMREGNIILDVLERSAEELSADDLDQLYRLDNSGPAPPASALLERARTNALTLLEINPSYGATCSVLAKSFELVGREDWLTRYFLRPSVC